MVEMENLHRDLISDHHVMTIFRTSTKSINDVKLDSQHFQTESLILDVYMRTGLSHA